MNTYKEVHLYYKDKKSNKEYHLLLEKSGSGYQVIAKFGPRDGTLTHVNKTKGSTSWWSALDMFDKTENEKRNKGYKDLETPRQNLIKALKKAIPYTYLSTNDWDKLAGTVEEYIEENA